MDFEFIALNELKNTPAATTYVIDPGVVYAAGPVSAGLRVATQVGAPTNVGLVPILVVPFELNDTLTYFVEGDLPMFLRDGGSEMKPSVGFQFQSGIAFRRKETTMSMKRRFAAEVFGTFWLVFGGCGSAVLAAAFPNVGIGLLGVSLAFGLTVLTMAYAIGHVSGCHLNPAVTVGLAVARRFPSKEIPAYVAAQVIGAVAGAATLYVIASGQAGFDVHRGFASNGFGEHSPGGYGLGACIVAEVRSSSPSSSCS